MATVKELIATADAEVGTTSGEKYWDYCREHWYPWLGPYVNGSITPYCAAFLSWLFDVTDTKCEGFPSLQAFDQSWQANGRRVEAYDLQKGDAINFDWDGGGGDHVGVVKERLDAGYYLTVEGNAGNAVRHCWRDASEILYGIRPYCDEEDEVTDADIDKIATAAAKKCAEYVFGESDRKANLNMYNATHWGYGYAKKCYAMLEKVYDLLKQIASALGIKQ